MASTAEDERAFCQWLADNGATHPKVQWPASGDHTVRGVRGAVALADIEPGEPMLHIPSRLMISPVTCRRSPEIGHVFRDNEALFRRDDCAIAVFLLYERARGEESFWAPFLRILAHPATISDWTDTELAELQDATLAREARSRDENLRRMHRMLFRRLSARYPDIFPAADTMDDSDVCAPADNSSEANEPAPATPVRVSGAQDEARAPFGFCHFRWAWNTVQARAFGRRLPWTALVPFADCLNHSNVAVVYDYKHACDAAVDAEGVFRLYPVGDTRYAAGEEVFNSYGRRDNRHLLLDYGFALDDNEWDTAVLELHFGRTTPLVAAADGTRPAWQQPSTSKSTHNDHAGASVDAGVGVDAELNSVASGSDVGDCVADSVADSTADSTVARALADRHWRARADLLMRCHFTPGMGGGGVTGGSVAADGRAPWQISQARGQQFKVRGDELCTEALVYLRLAMLTTRERESFERELREEGSASEQLGDKSGTSATTRAGAGTAAALRAAAGYTGGISARVRRRELAVPVRRRASRRVGVGLDNELRALRALESCMRALLDAAPTTLAEDTAALAVHKNTPRAPEASLPPRLEAALRFRCGWKRVITRQIALLQLVRCNLESVCAHAQMHCGSQDATYGAEMQKRTQARERANLFASLARYATATLEHAPEPRPARMDRCATERVDPLASPPPPPPPPVHTYASKAEQQDTSGGSSNSNSSTTPKQALSRPASTTRQRVQLTPLVPVHGTEQRAVPED